jgi:hypothetical protein
LLNTATNRSVRSVEALVREACVGGQSALCRRLFIHPKAAFTDEEWNGFSEACLGGTNLVGVAGLARFTFAT